MAITATAKQQLLLWAFHNYYNYTLSVAMLAEFWVPFSFLYMAVFPPLFLSLSSYLAFLPSYYSSRFS